MYLADVLGVSDPDAIAVLGIGGGGDVVGACHTLRWVRDELDPDVLVVGGLTWERSVVDPEPGPRSRDEIVGDVVWIHERVGVLRGEARPRRGKPFAESRVRRALRRLGFEDVEVVLLDVGGGFEGTVEALEAMFEEFGLDVLVGVDVGGDALAKGNEPGVESPLADSIMTASLAELNDTVMGVFGWGSDGELSLEELRERFAEIASKGGYLGAIGLTRSDVEFLGEILRDVETEASALPVMAASEGELGPFEIRGGHRRVVLEPASTCTFYFDPAKVAEDSELCDAVRGTRSVLEAHERVRERLGIKTELDWESEGGVR
ncbi:MAG: DUF1152 domain-containing protein [Methanopyri archaeon]|nr:DUF1152 domain-containing protein [Methanopyri archaeon]